MENKIYLNSAAGCKVYPEVIETMNDVLLNHWGNASSETSDGVDAKNIINDVAHQIVKDINCDNISEIIFTSGACEANSLAIKGFMSANNSPVLVTSKLEHTSIEEIEKAIHSLHVNELCVVEVENDIHGNIILSDLENKCRRLRRPFVSISFANSEIGVIQDIKSISDIVHSYNGTLHVDSTQAFPWIDIDVKELGIDMMSVSAQKFHGPRGIGFLYVKNGVFISAQINGSQQGGLRGGTYPTHLIAGMGKALEIIRSDRESKFLYVLEKRNELFNSLSDSINGMHLNGPNIYINRLPNNISVYIDGVDAEKLVIMADMLGVIISRSSACKAYSPEPSKTLMNIKLNVDQALSTIRITIDETITKEDIDKAVKVIAHLVERIRKENA